MNYVSLRFSITQRAAPVKVRLFSFWNADLFKMEGFASSRNFILKA